MVHRLVICIVMLDVTQFFINAINHRLCPCRAAGLLLCSTIYT